MFINEYAYLIFLLNTKFKQLAKGKTVSGQDNQEIRPQTSKFFFPDVYQKTTTKCFLSYC